ncbi:sodium:solute symporter [Acetobacter sp. DsW_063]|uniref:sodium:solute symporter n=1 Tax=Acetobacter sp. DsW_063 TaxID=1514894 RepID=UPI000A398AEA|nr:sodium:solute symporter [Acetobacter sp. DsW_063]OUJ16177.1 sodium:proline symporter [Acetobacter sp. DsW_063]
MTGLLDPVVILAWLVALTAGSLWMSRASRTGADLVEAHHDLPAWAICLSIVATETSTLTVISIPGIAYGHGFVFVGLGAGYLLGRFAVARVMLPLYMRGDLASAYDYLGLRFGPAMQRLASVTFLLTRLLAEGVRLFAATLPVCALLAARGLPLSPLTVLVGMTALTAVYTAIGGLRAVVWSDTAQFTLYAFGAAISAWLLWRGLDATQQGAIWNSGRLAVFGFHDAVLTSPYAPVTAIVGGALLAMASHGADQLMVQRAMAARSLRDAQRAMVASAVVVTALFALLSLCGVLLWAREGGRALADMGFRSPDELFPRFIVQDLPPGLSGLLVAGVISATMGSLSSALNAMTGSTLSDLLGRRDESRFLARAVTAFWAVALIAAALAFAGSSHSALVFGLQIAGYSYGALLGAFLLGLVVRGAQERAAMAAFLATIVVMAMIIGFVRPGGATIAFPWLVPLGVCVTFLVGAPLTMLSRRGRA